MKQSFGPGVGAHLQSCASAFAPLEQTLDVGRTDGVYDAWLELFLFIHFWWWMMRMRMRGWWMMRFMNDEDDEWLWWEDERIRGWEDERMRGWEDERMRGWEDERMRGWEDERMMMMMMMVYSHTLQCLLRYWTKGWAFGRNCWHTCNVVFDKVLIDNVCVCVCLGLFGYVHVVQFVAKCNVTPCKAR